MILCAVCVCGVRRCAGGVSGRACGRAGGVSGLAGVLMSISVNNGATHLVAFDYACLRLTPLAFT